MIQLKDRIVAFAAAWWTPTLIHPRRTRRSGIAAGHHPGDHASGSPAMSQESPDDRKELQMRINKSSRQVRTGAVFALALLTLTTGAALAAVPATTAYKFSSHPMISGTVISVNDHQMVVDTDQGEQVTLEMDSRTMAPRDLGPGMVMRAEFLALEDCRFYAQRILPIRNGMSTNRLQAYANTRDSREAIAHSAASMGGYRRAGMERQASAGSGERLPQTMSEYSPGTTMTATPATADYRFSTRPIISGTVLVVNDHRLVVETDQGQRVGMVMDSHTMVPGDVGPGTVLRAEFRQMKDGRYYAERISRIGSDVAGREQAYANTRDSDLLLAQNVPDCGFVGAAGNTQTSVVEHGESATPSGPVAVAMLPQTASGQPLILVLGLLALGASGLIAGLGTALRGLRTV